MSIKEQHCWMIVHLFIPNWRLDSGYLIWKRRGAHAHVRYDCTQPWLKSDDISQTTSADNGTRIVIGHRKVIRPHHCLYTVCKT